MPALVIDALEVKANLARLPDESDGRQTKLAWSGSVYAADDAAYSALKAKTSAGPLRRTANFQLRGLGADVSVSGDAIGAAITARVMITGEAPYIRSGGTWYFVVPVSIRQV